MKPLLPLLMLSLFFAGCVSRHPVMATSNPVYSDKEGESCGHYIGLPIIGVALTSFLIAGDEDIFSAAKKSDIKEISTVDKRTTNYLLYKKQCTVVHGR